MEDYTQKGSIYSHVSGDFRIRERKGRAYEIEYADRPALWISTGTKSFEEASRIAIRQLHSQRRFLSNERVTLRQFAKDMFKRRDKNSIYARNEKFGRHHPSAYYTNRQGVLDSYILVDFGDYDITRITDVMIEDWYIALEGRKWNRPISNEYKLRILETFRMVMKEAKRGGIIDSNPCDSVQRVSKDKRPPKNIFRQEEIALLFPIDFERLEMIWGSLRWALYFSILLDTGFRPGEALVLGRHNLIIDGDRYGIYSEDSYDVDTHDVKHKIKTSEKGKGEKIGVLSDYTVRILKAVLARIDEDEEFLFRINGSFPKSVSDPNAILRNACDILGIDIGTRTQYDFRHTFDTHMLNSLGDGIEESDVQDLMAHTGYRPEYDHRTPEQIVTRLMKVKPAIDSIRTAAN